MTGERAGEARLWGARFASAPADDLIAFTQSISFDRVLVREDCAVLAAHAHALARAGLLSDTDAAETTAALAAVVAQIENPAFAPDPSDEDIHTVVERALAERIPAIAPRLRAGLSRNDRVAAALRLWTLARGRELIASICDLIDVFVARAQENRSVLLPGYTHLQRAQPVTLAHHLLAHAFAFARDAHRVRDALARANTSPLGAGALAGSTLRLAQDPARLGFATAMENSLDAVAARDFVAEVLAVAAICGVHCSRVGEELVLWTSREFSFAEFDDAYATGSSMMPQKKNPDIAELARGKTGRLIGNLTGTLAMLKGLPLAYNRDLQEDKEPLFDSIATLRTMLPALTGALATMRFATDTMQEAAKDGALLATDLAEYLVQHGVAFRDAHDIVGAIVRHLIQTARDLTTLTLDELRAFSDAFAEDVTSVIDAATSVERRATPGPNAASIDQQRRSLATITHALRDGLTV